MNAEDVDYAIRTNVLSSTAWERAVAEGLPRLPPEDIEEIDVDSDLETLELSNDDGADIRFQGEVIASVSSFRPENDVNWTEIDLYRTRGGKWVAHQIGRSKLAGHRTR